MAEDRTKDEAGNDQPTSGTSEQSDKRDKDSEADVQGYQETAAMSDPPITGGGIISDPPITGGGGGGGKA